MMYLDGICRAQRSLLENRVWGLGVGGDNERSVCVCVAKNTPFYYYFPQAKEKHAILGH